MQYKPPYLLIVVMHEHNSGGMRDYFPAHWTLWFDQDTFNDASPAEHVSTRGARTVGSDVQAQGALFPIGGQTLLSIKIH